MCSIFEKRHNFFSTIYCHKCWNVCQCTYMDVKKNCQLFYGWKQDVTNLPYFIILCITNLRLHEFPMDTEILVTSKTSCQLYTWQKFRIIARTTSKCQHGFWLFSKTLLKNLQRIDDSLADPFDFIHHSFENHGYISKSIP
jgi:hypothetical protein